MNINTHTHIHTHTHTGEVQFAFRARETIRFGKIRSIVFSKNNQFLFCGDIAGALWCFHIQSESLIAKIETHDDIIYDLAIHGKLPV